MTNFERNGNLNQTHLIKHDGLEFSIGHVNVSKHVINGVYHSYCEEFHTNDYVIKRLANYPCAADSYIYLFQIYNLDDGELHFYTVGDKTLYDKTTGEYYERIIYDNKLQANDVRMAFIEFAIYCEPLSY